MVTTLLTNIPSLNLSETISDLITRLCAGSELIYRLNIAGYKCSNVFDRYNCEDCILPVNIFTGELKGELCTACKLFFKLEREYYILRILQLIEEMVKQKEEKPEWMKTKKEKTAEIQMNLF
jgi:hypothetical protein